MSTNKASQLYHVPRTTLRNKCSGKSPELSIGHSGTISVLGEEMELMLVQWVLSCSRMGFPVGRESLLSSVKKLVDEACIKTPFAHNRPGKKWFYGFLNRHKIISQKHSEYVNRARGSVTEAKIKSWFKEVYELLGENARVLEDPNRVFNMDETCFNLAPKGELIIGERGKNVYDEHTNSDKENVTTLFGTNALGKWAPCLSIFKYERIPAALAKSAPPGWGIGKSETGWMTAETFYEYITNIFLPFLNDVNIERPVIVFLDGHKSHLSLHLSKFCREHGLILISLYPNSTHILQPLDVAVFGPLKARWKKIVKQWRIENEKEITKLDVPKALAQIINDDGMVKNIQSGFRVTGLYPYNADSVDYSKIIVRNIPNLIHQTTSIIDEMKAHLAFIETNINKIDVDLVTEFKRTYRGKYEWDGNEKASMLFSLWSGIMEDINIQENEIIQTNNTATALLQASTSPTLENSNEHLNPDMWLSRPSTSQAEETISTNPNTVIPAKRSLATVFNDIIKWPVQQQSKSTRKKEYTPSVITSNKWIEFHDLKAAEKLEKEKKKEERKLATLEKRKQAEIKKNENAQIKANKMKPSVVSDSESSESNKSWISKNDSSNDDLLAEPLSNDLVKKITNLQQDLKPGDYVLVKFKPVGKKQICYKYVATVIRVISETELEVQYFESIDEEHTEFILAEGDISLVDLDDIVYKLPTPELNFKNRQYISVFPGIVDVYEKFK